MIEAAEHPNLQSRLKTYALWMHILGNFAESL
jgi:hypothetical protein